MTNPLQKIVNEFDRLRQSPSFIWWDRWIPDESWVEYIVQWGRIGIPITKRDFNRSFQHSDLYIMILTFDKKNDFGVYYHNKYVNNQKVSFYYVSRNNDVSPERPTDKDVWLKYFNENRIVRSTRKRAYEPSQQIRAVTPVPPDDGDTAMPSPAELHEKSRQISGSFWKD